MNKRISIHHVGGRDGHGSFPLESQFQPDLVLTFYDADADCVEQIKERNRYLKSEINVLPYCLGLKQGEATLFINYDPYTSSLFPPNPVYRDYRVIGNYGAFGREFDYVLGDAMKSMEQRTLATVALDELLASGRLSSPPDFLSIDTQGSEYNILAGASEVLKHTTLGVALEAEYHPLYLGQKLFGDVSQLLAGHGFIFVGFSEEASTFTPGASPITLRGKGIKLYDDALFLRTPQSIGAEQGEPQRCLRLYKLAFMSVIFHQVELAAECLRLAEASPAADAVRGELALLAYGKFLADFQAAVKRQRPYFPVTFQSQFTFEASRSRFTTSDQRGVGWLERIRDWCLRKPERWRTIKRILQPISSYGRRAKLFFTLLGAGKAFWRHPALQWRTEVERVLRRYGLYDQEKTVRRIRWKHAPFCEEAPGNPSNGKSG